MTTTYTAAEFRRIAAQCFTDSIGSRTERQDALNTAADQADLLETRSSDYTKACSTILEQAEELGRVKEKLAAYERPCEDVETLICELSVLRLYDGSDPHYVQKKLEFAASTIETLARQLREALSALEQEKADHLETENFCKSEIAMWTDQLRERDERIAGLRQIGWAREMSNGKLSLLETTLSEDEIHDTGRPLHPLFIQTAARKP